MRAGRGLSELRAMRLHRSAAREAALLALMPSPSWYGWLNLAPPAFSVSFFDYRLLCFFCFVVPAYCLIFVCQLASVLLLTDNCLSVSHFQTLHKLSTMTLTIHCLCSSCVLSEQPLSLQISVQMTLPQPSSPTNTQILLSILFFPLEDFTKKQFRTYWCSQSFNAKLAHSLEWNL